MNVFGSRSSATTANPSLPPNRTARGGPCMRCLELSRSRTRIVMPLACQPGGLLVIADAPGLEDDRTGECVSGMSGRTIEAMLASHGLERGRDYGVATLVRCRPPAGRRPWLREIEHCLPKLAGLLLTARARVLLLAGQAAANVFLGNRPVLEHIEYQRKAPRLLPFTTHPILAPVVNVLNYLVEGGMYAVPVPFPTGRTWWKQLPDGRRLVTIAEEQVAMAVSLLRSAAHAC